MSSNKETRVVRFDWAMKHLLRNKANYDIVEGFLSALLEDNELRVLEILESESNKETTDDKFNRVDVIIKDSQGRKILIEIQNSRETDYLYRILYSASKHISQSISSGDQYLKIEKIISVNILYFDLDIGNDYLYYGSTEFVGVNTKERLSKDSATIKKLIPKGARYNVLEIYPEYYLIQVDKYQNVVKRAIDEWIYWMKNETIKVGSSSKNIQKVEEKLNILKMSKKERVIYENYLEKLAADRNILETALEDGYNKAINEYQHLLDKAEQRAEQAKQRAEQERKARHEMSLTLAKTLKDLGVETEEIVNKTGLSRNEIENL